MSKERRPVSAIRPAARLMAAALGTALALGTATPSAQAQDVSCTELDNPVYIFAGSTVLPLLNNLGRRLRDSQTHPMTLVFVDGRSCAIMESIINGTPLEVNLNYVPSTEEDPDWTPDLSPRQCVVPEGGVPIDLTHADIFPESCGAGLEDNLGDVKIFPGPVLSFNFVVPPSSSQEAITAEEAYFVWGFGQAGGVTPWTDEEFLFTRPNTAGTKITFGAHIGVPAARWKGVELAKTGDVINAVSSSINAEATLGIVGGANFDGNRDKLKTLAFQGFGQNAAWYADSTPTAFDKRNVRDGHYMLWAPAVFMTRVDGQGTPTNPNVDVLLRILQSRAVEPALEFNGTGVLIDEGFIPDCAMGVARDGQAGDLSLYTPDEPCACFFEERLGIDTGCQPCADDAECANGATCNLGFCEGGQ